MMNDWRHWILWCCSSDKFYLQKQQQRDWLLEWKMLKFKDGSHEIRRERVEAVSNLCGDWTGDRRNKVTRCWFCDIIYSCCKFWNTSWAKWPFHWWRKSYVGENYLSTGEEKSQAGNPERIWDRICSRKQTKWLTKCEKYLLYTFVVWLCWVMSCEYWP